MARTAWAIALLLGCRLAVGQALEPTPPDALGPFYPDRLPADADDDLVHIAGRAGSAEGVALELRGRIVDTGGSPLEGIRVELWQTDARGCYIHSADPCGSRRDPAFQGYGVALSNAAGNYRFMTVEPGRYASRPPHFHLRLADGRGVRLVTQAYLPGARPDPGMSAARMALREQHRSAPVIGGDFGLPVLRFDIVLPARR